MKLFRKIDVILLGIVSVICLLISVFDTLDIFDNLPVIKNLNYSLLAVILLALIGVYLVAAHVKQDGFQVKIERELEALVPSIKGAQVKTFDSSEDMENYMAEMIRKAKKQVCDFTWKQSLSESHDLPARIRSRKSYDDSIKLVSKNVQYKEIFIFSDKRRLEKLKKRVEENRTGYSCKYFEEYCNIPRLQYILIDSEEVIFASSSYRVLMAIRNKEIGNLLQNYFDSVWDKAIYIMKGTEVYKEVYHHILDKYDK